MVLKTKDRVHNTVQYILVNIYGSSCYCIKLAIRVRNILFNCRKPSNYVMYSFVFVDATHLQRRPMEAKPTALATL